MHKTDGRWQILFRVGVPLFAALSLIGLLLIIRVVMKHRLEARIQAKLDAIHAAGEPLTAEDFAKTYPHLPDSENSALVYLQACSNMVDLNLPDSNEPRSPLRWVATNTSPSAPIPPETKAALREWLEINRTALELLHAGARIKDGRYPLDFSQGLIKVGKSPRLNRRLSRLLAWDAILAVEGGRTGVAFRSLIDSFAIARSLKDHPFVIMQALREVSVEDVRFAVERIVNQTHLPEEQLHELQTSFREARGVSWIKTSLIFERDRQLEFYCLLPEPPPGYLFLSPGSVRQYAWWRFLLYPQKGMAAYLEIMNHYIAAAKLPISQRLVAAQTIDNEVESNQHLFNGWFPAATYWNPLTSEVTESQAEIVTVEVALAVERYRSANAGRIPDKLQDLVPAFLDAVPLGPADPKPLGFKKVGNGYSISAAVLECTDGLKLEIRKTVVSFDVAQ